MDLTNVKGRYSLVKRIQIPKVSRKKLYLPPILTLIVWLHHYFTHSKSQRWSWISISSNRKFWFPDFEFEFFEQSGFCLHFLTSVQATEHWLNSKRGARFIFYWDAVQSKGLISQQMMSSLNGTTKEKSFLKSDKRLSQKKTKNVKVAKNHIMSCQRQWAKADWAKATLQAVY